MIWTLIVGLDFDNENETDVPITTEKFDVLEYNDEIPTEKFDVSEYYDEIPDKFDAEVIIPDKFDAEVIILNTSDNDDDTEKGFEVVG